MLLLFGLGSVELLVILALPFLFAFYIAYLIKWIKRKDD